MFGPSVPGPGPCPCREQRLLCAGQSQQQGGVPGAAQREPGGAHAESHPGGAGHARARVPPEGERSREPNSSFPWLLMGTALSAPWFWLPALPLGQHQLLGRGGTSCTGQRVRVCAAVRLTLCRTAHPSVPASPAAPAVCPCLLPRADPVLPLVSRLPCPPCRSRSCSETPSSAGK